MPVMFMSEDKLKNLVYDTLTINVLGEMLMQLDPEKHYILVVPLEISEDALQKAFSGYKGTNLVVLRAKNVKLLEF